MAALFEGTARGLAGGPQSNARLIRQPVDPASVTAGLNYIRQCLRGHRPFGVITGPIRGLHALLVRIAADCAARDELHTVRITSPTDSVREFLSTCLAQLGFELADATLDDLHNLMVVFLRHESARGRRTVVIVESTDHCGPHVLELMQTLSRVRAGTTPAITFVLTGSPGLLRILDSPGMAGLRRFTRQRFDLECGPIPESPASQDSAQAGAPVNRRDPAHRVLEVVRDGRVVERHELLPGRLLIGRSRQSGLHLDSRFVSRNHAAVLVTPSEVVVVDLRSTNSTLVNGKACVSQKLEHGDVVAIGNFRLRYNCRRTPAALGAGRA